jgi:hypothetical protein
MYIIHVWMDNPKKRKGKSPNFGHLMYKRNLLEIPSIEIMF